MRRRSIATLVIPLILATTAGAQERHLGLSLSAGVAGPVAELSPHRGPGLTLEAMPDWRFGSGLSVGLGFRYTIYDGVPDREAIVAEIRYTRPEGAEWRPVIGLRGAGFHGGDDPGEDAYIGLEFGPVLGIERSVGEHLAVQAVGWVAGVFALFRDPRILPSAGIGLVFR